MVAGPDGVRWLLARKFDGRWLHLPGAYQEGTLGQFLAVDQDRIAVEIPFHPGPYVLYANLAPVLHVSHSAPDGVQLEVPKGTQLQYKSAVNDPWTLLSTPSGTVMLPAAGVSGFFRVVEP
jgi:hypothetical protein